MAKECVTCGEPLNGHGNKKYCSEACRDVKNGKDPLEMPEPDYVPFDPSIHEDPPVYCPLTRKDCMFMACSWFIGPEPGYCAVWGIGKAIGPNVKDL